uniref:PIR Superfamily Protein n=1 Tax=Rhabditophanes sp. KR3021 TaxID=114890 RepID=A0AC35UCF6_9BILA
MNFVEKISKQIHDFLLKFKELKDSSGIGPSGQKKLEKKSIPNLETLFYIYIYYLNKNNGREEDGDPWYVKFEKDLISMYGHHANMNLKWFKEIYVTKFKEPLERECREAVSNNKEALHAYISIFEQNENCLNSSNFQIPYEQENGESETKNSVIRKYLSNFLNSI